MNTRIKEQSYVTVTFVKLEDIRRYKERKAIHGR